MKKLILLILLLFSFTSFSQSYNLQSGINYLKEQKYDEAMSFLKKELAQNPKEGVAHYYIGLIHVKNKAYSQGLTSINQAISLLNPNDTLISNAWSLKGNIYYQIEDYEKFETSFAKALELNPTEPFILYGRAYGYVKFNKYEKALADLFKIIEINEENIVARGLITRIYLKQEKYEDVFKNCDRILKLDPDFTDAYEIRSYAYFKLSKHDLAIIDAFEAMKLNENDTRIQSNFIRYTNKNLTLGLAKISTLIKEFPQKDSWLYVRSQIYRNKKEYKNALADFAKIFDMIPETEKSYYLSERAELYGEMGMHDKAIIDFTESIKLDSSSAYDFGHRGDEYRLLGNYQAAILDFDKAIEINPEEPWFYYRRGWVKDEFLKDPEGGLADYTSAIEIDQNYAYTYLNRGRLYANHYKDTLHANADFRKIVELDTIISHQGNARHYAYLELGKYDLAKSWNNKILHEFPEEGNYYDAACLYSKMKLPTQSIAYLDTAFKKGYRDFEHLSKDDDLENIRNLPEFKSLIARWKASFEVSKPKNSNNENSGNKIIGTYVIPFKPKGGGTYEVESKINGLPLKMLFDTGASDILISQIEVDFMLKNGYLKEQDFIGSDNYYTASQEKIEAKTVMLRQVEIGGLTLKNVRAAVIENRKAGMLFGQSALSRYGKITIDNQKKRIIITGNSK
ncbi:TPR end-of-group domain-containing protein [Aquirufa sp. ROCK-SH2]